MDASLGLLSRLMELNELRKHLSAAKPNEKVKMHLGEEWWAELDHQQALGFIDRRQQLLMKYLQPERVSDNTPESVAIECSVPTPPQVNEELNSERLDETGHRPLEILSEAITGLVEDSSAADGVDVTQDGTVLNEEGLPFMDIREPLAGPSSPARKVEDAEPAMDSSMVDDYWSAEAVERRRRLRQRVLGSDSDEEGDYPEDAARSEVPVPERPQQASSAIAPTSSSPVATTEALKVKEHPLAQPGRLVRSTVISGDTPPSPDDITKDLAQPSKSSTSPTRRKSVTFAATAEVSDGAGTISTVECSQSEEPKPLTPSAAAKARNDAFAGFKKGFLASAFGPPAKPRSTQSVQSSIQHASAQPAPAMPIIQLNGTVTSSSSTTDAPATATRKPKQSLFSQRKAQAKAARQMLDGEADPNNIAPTPRQVSAPAKQAMQSMVTEREPAIRPNPAMAGPRKPLVSEGKVLPPGEAVLKRESASDRVFKGSVVEKPPIIVNTTQSAMAGPSQPSQQASSEGTSSEQDNDSEDEVLEYSDDELEEDAFDMDDAMLAREAALAYHAKRAEMGRKGLGGWTGAVGSDGQLEWDHELMGGNGSDEEAHQSDVVGFGERVLPAGLLQTVTRASEGPDEDTSISLPSIIPAGVSLSSAVRVGKLEDGKLIIPAGEDSDDSEAEEVVDDKSKDNTFARERREIRARKKDLIRKISEGDWRDLAEEEERRRPASTRSEGPTADRLPSIKPAPVVDATKRTSDNQTPAPKVQGLRGEQPASVPPRKISRFKAARMQQGQ